MTPNDLAMLLAIHVTAPRTPLVPYLTDPKAPAHDDSLRFLRQCGLIEFDPVRQRWVTTARGGDRVDIACGRTR